MAGARGRVGVRNGTVVTDSGTLLRGGAIRFFRYGLSTGATPAVMDPAYYRQLRACRLNAVRIAVMDAWQRSQNYPHWDISAPVDRADFLAKLDTVVELATDEGLYVLIDYHDEGRYDRAHVELFWDLVGPRYRDRPLVFYEPTNEPVQWGPNAYTDAVLDDQQRIYQHVRSLAPDTHLVLLSFARFTETSIAKPGESMLRVAQSLRGIDWTNASVGVHGYGACSSAPLTELGERFPILCTELDLPAHAGGTAEFLNALDGAEYPQQVYERLGISWFGWNIDSHEQLERGFRRGVLADAAARGYLWPADRPVEPGMERHSHVLRFFEEVPVRDVLGRMGWRRSHLVACLALACMAAFFDFVALALVVPLVQGAAQGSFDFLWRNPWLTRLVPGSSPPGYSTMFVVLVLAAFAAGVAKSGVFHGLHLLTGRLYGRYSARLADLAFRRSLLFGKAYFDANDRGALAATLDRHHDLLRLFQGLLRLMSESLVLVAYVLVLLLLSWKLTLVVLAVLPAMHLVRRSIARRIQKPVDDSRAHVQAIASQTWDTLSAVDVYQAFGREEDAARAHAGLLERIRHADFQVWRHQGLLPRAQEVTSLVALLGILALAYAVEPHSMNIVRLLVFFFVARLALASLGVYQEVELRFASTMPSAAQFLDLFSDRGKFILPSGSRRLEGLADSIRFQHVIFGYPGRSPVLHDVSFVIQKGKMTALVGPSGSGKTTLAHLVTRAYDVQPHSVVFDGVNVRDLTLESIRRQVAVVGQDVALLNDTLRRNVTIGLDRDPTSEELAHVVSAACLEDVVAALPGGLDGRIGAHGTLLSGGQRQRVAIARALLRHTPILILDEATSGIDSETEARIQRAIENAVQGCTSLVIAHRLATIRRADWVVVLEKGRVTEQGTLRDLLARTDGRFRAMWDAQRFD